MSKQTTKIDVVPGKSVSKRIPDKKNLDRWETEVKAEYAAEIKDAKLTLTFTGSRKVWREFEKNMNIKTPKHFFQIQLFPSKTPDLDDHT